MYSRIMTIKSTDNYSDNTEIKHSAKKIKEAIESADAIVIGAGAGLSTL